MAEPTWRLDGEGKGRLLLADGVARELPYRKVGELLARLAQARPSGCDRAELARLMWPSATRIERMTNLRQALARLRALVGSDSIAATRDHCRFLGDATILGYEAFITNGERAGAEPPSRSVPTFGEEVLALSRVSGEEALARLAGNPEAGFAIPSKNLREILTNLRAQSFDGGWAGWHRYWRAMTVFTRELPTAMRPLEAAYQFAVEQGDGNLVSLASYWLGAGEILLGLPARAGRVADAALPKVTDRAHRCRILNLQAHVQLHLGATEDAVLELRRIEDGTEGTERHTTEALRALYLAYAGRIAVAERILDDLDRSGGPDEARHRYGAGLARCVVETLDLTSESLARCEAFCDRMANLSQRHFELYGRELLYLRSLERRHGAEAHSQLARIRALRSSIGLVPTQWDRLRWAGHPPV